MLGVACVKVLSSARRRFPVSWGRERRLELKERGLAKETVMLIIRDDKLEGA
jgi:hypothetical protein